VATPLQKGSQENTVYRYFKLTLLGVALVLPIAASTQDRDDRQEKREEVKRYEDRAYHDSHEWNEREDRAYRRYLEEHHKKYHEFERASKKEQQDYWKWRHNHPDDDRR
jgi:ribulose kinase